MISNLLCTRAVPFIPPFVLPILLSVERWLGLLGISLAELDGAFAQSCRNARLALHANEVQAKSTLSPALHAFRSCTSSSPQTNASASAHGASFTWVLHALVKLFVVRLESPPLHVLHVVFIHYSWFDWGHLFSMFVV